MSSLRRFICWSWFTVSRNPKQMETVMLFFLPEPHTQGWQGGQSMPNSSLQSSYLSFLALVSELNLTLWQHKSTSSTNSPKGSIKHQTSDNKHLMALPQTRAQQMRYKHHILFTTLSISLLTVCPIALLGWCSGWWATSYCVVQMAKRLLWTVQ